MPKGERPLGSDLGKLQEKLQEAAEADAPHLEIDPNEPGATKESIDAALEGTRDSVARLKIDPLTLPAWRDLEKNASSLKALVDAVAASTEQKETDSLEEALSREATRFAPLHATLMNELREAVQSKRRARHQEAPPEKKTMATAPERPATLPDAREEAPLGDAQKLESLYARLKAFDKRELDADARRVLFDAMAGAREADRLLKEDRSIRNLVRGLERSVNILDRAPRQPLPSATPEEAERAPRTEPAAAAERLASLKEGLAAFDEGQLAPRAQEALREAHDKIRRADELLGQNKPIDKILGRLSRLARTIEEIPGKPQAGAGDAQVVEEMVAPLRQAATERREGRPAEKKDREFSRFKRAAGLAITGDELEEVRRAMTGGMEPPQEPPPYGPGGDERPAPDHVPGSELPRQYGVWSEQKLLELQESADDRRTDPIDRETVAKEPRAQRRPAVRKEAKGLAALAADAAATVEGVARAKQTKEEREAEKARKREERERSKAIASYVASDEFKRALDAHGPFATQEGRLTQAEVKKLAKGYLTGKIRDVPTTVGDFLSSLKPVQTQAELETGAGAAPRAEEGVPEPGAQPPERTVLPPEQVERFMSVEFRKRYDAFRKGKGVLRDDAGSLMTISAIETSVADVLRGTKEMADVPTSVQELIRSFGNEEAPEAAPLSPQNEAEAMNQLIVSLTERLKAARAQGNEGAASAHEERLRDLHRQLRALEGKGDEEALALEHRVDLPIEGREMDPARLTPAGEARIAALAEARAEAASALGAALERRGEERREQTSGRERGFLNKWAARYNRIPRKYVKAAKITLIALGAAALTGGLGMGTAGIAFGAARVISGAGVFAALATGTSRWRNKWLAGGVTVGGTAAMLFAFPSAVQYLNEEFGLGGKIRSLLGLGPLPDAPRVPAADVEKGTPAPRPEGPGSPGEPPQEARPEGPADNPPQAQGNALFTEPVTFGKGDATLSHLVDRQMRLMGEYEGLSKAERAAKLYDPQGLLNRLSRMSPDELRTLGFSSGNINIINPGDVLHLDKVPLTEMVAEGRPDLPAEGQGGGSKLTPPETPGGEASDREAPPEGSETGSAMPEERGRTDTDLSPAQLEALKAQEASLTRALMQQEIKEVFGTRGFFGSFLGGDSTGFERYRMHDWRSVGGILDARQLPRLSGAELENVKDYFIEKQRELGVDLRNMKVKEALEEVANLKAKQELGL